jgi:hypothetical protein
VARVASRLYKPLIASLAERSVSAYFQQAEQLVISTQAGPAWPFAGNSFWVSRRRRRWYLCTWGPVCYEVPPGKDFVALCTEFVKRGRCAQVFVPSELVQKHDLRQLECEEFERLFSDGQGPRWPR